jgi:hypothetical protein
MRPTIEELKAAEKRKDDAGAALVAGIQRGVDSTTHDRLNEEYLAAHENFLDLVEKLKP